MQDSPSRDRVLVSLCRRSSAGTSLASEVLAGQVRFKIARAVHGISNLKSQPRRRVGLGESSDRRTGSLVS